MSSNGGRFSGFLNFLKLNDSEYDDYDDDLDDDLEEEEAYEAPKKEKTKRFYTKRTAVKDEDTGDDDRDEAPERSERGAERTSSERRSSQRRTGGRGRNERIVSMRSPYYSGMEVCVIKPIDFDSSREIADTILSGKAAVINFSGVTTAVAQRIIDFAAGTCYSIDGNIQRISDSIIIVTSKDITISGDLEDIITTAQTDVNVPSFDLENLDI